MHFCWFELSRDCSCHSLTCPFLPSNSSLLLAEITELWKCVCSNLFVRQRKLGTVYGFINKYTTAGYQLGLGHNSKDWQSNREPRQHQGAGFSSANRAQDTAGRGGRAFGLARLCLLIFNSPCCFHSSVTIPSCSWPCSGCFHSHPQLPVPCHYSYKRARALGAAVPLWCPWPALLL